MILVLLQCHCGKLRQVAYFSACNFLKSDGKPILNHTLIVNLLDVVSAHTKLTGPSSLGNASADASTLVYGWGLIVIHAYVEIFLPILLN